MRVVVGGWRGVSGADLYLEARLDAVATRTRRLAHSERKEGDAAEETGPYMSSGYTRALASTAPAAPAAACPQGGICLDCAPMLGIEHGGMRA